MDQMDLLDRAEIARDFLTVNSGSHVCPFGAMAELIDNAVDAKATLLHINYHEQFDMLSFLDNGDGMDKREVIDAICFGKSSKKGLPGYVGQYGNGLKAGTMRIGRDVLLVTRKHKMYTVMMISRTFLDDTKAAKCFIPIISLELSGDGSPTMILDVGDSKEKYEFAKEMIIKYSPYHTESDLIEELKRIIADNGTCVYIYNLSRLDNERKEFDFSSKYDFQLSQASEKQRKSFREYLQELYAHPAIVIKLRNKTVEKEVDTHVIVQSLAVAQSFEFTPNGLKSFADRKKIEISKNMEQVRQELDVLTAECSSLLSNVTSDISDLKSKSARLRLASARKTDKTAQLEEMEKLLTKREKVGSLKVVVGLNILDRSNCGILLYSNGRLIEKCLSPQQKQSRRDRNNRLIGVTCVLDMPSIVLPPNPSKQKFQSQKELSCIITSLSDIMNKFWDEGITEDWRNLTAWQPLGYKSMDWLAKSSLKDSEKKAIYRLICVQRQCYICGTWRRISLSSELPPFPDNWECHDGGFDCAKKDSGFSPIAVFKPVKKSQPRNVGVVNVKNIPNATEEEEESIHFKTVKSEMDSTSRRIFPQKNTSMSIAVRKKAIEAEKERKKRIEAVNREKERKRNEEKKKTESVHRVERTCRKKAPIIEDDDEDDDVEMIDIASSTHSSPVKKRARRVREEEEEEEEVEVTPIVISSVRGRRNDKSESISTTTTTQSSSSLHRQCDELDKRKGELKKAQDKMIQLSNELAEMKKKSLVQEKQLQLVCKAISPLVPEKRKNLLQNECSGLLRKLESEPHLLKEFAIDFAQDNGKDEKRMRRNIVSILRMLTDQEPTAAPSAEIQLIMTMNEHNCDEHLQRIVELYEGDSLNHAI